MSDWAPSDVEAALPHLRRYARALTKDIEAADDLVQDALLRAYEEAGSFRPDRSLRSWLLSIVHNRFVDIERRRAVEQKHQCSPERLEAFSAQPSDPDRRLYLRQVADRFAALPAEQRSVLHLVAVEGLTYQQTAETLGLPIGTIMSRLNRARERLRRADSAAPDAAQLRIVGGRDER